MIFLLNLIFNAMAIWQTVTITASGGSPIPTSYTTSSTQSKVLTGPNGAGTASSVGISIINHTGSRICVDWVSGSLSSAPSSPNSTEFCLSDGEALLQDSMHVEMGNAIYLRSASGSAITSGFTQIGVQ